MSSETSESLDGGWMPCCCGPCASCLGGWLPSCLRIDFDGFGGGGNCHCFNTHGRVALTDSVQCTYGAWLGCRNLGAASLNARIRTSMHGPTVKGGHILDVWLSGNDPNYRVAWWSKNFGMTKPRCMDWDELSLPLVYSNWGNCAPGSCRVTSVDGDACDGGPLVAPAPYCAVCLGCRGRNSPEYIVVEIADTDTDSPGQGVFHCCNYDGMMNGKYVTKWYGCGCQWQWAERSSSFGTHSVNVTIGVDRVMVSAVGCIGTLGIRSFTSTKNLSTPVNCYSACSGAFPITQYGIPECEFSKPNPRFILTPM